MKTDKESLISVYERMYGESNGVEQVELAVESYKSKNTKRKRNRRRKKQSESVNETNVATINVNHVRIDEIIKGVNDMSKFNELFNSAVTLDEQMGGFEDENPVDAMMDAGDEMGIEEDEITVSLDRDMAKQLCDILQAAVGDDEEEGEEDIEMDIEGDELEEGAGEDSLQTAPDGVAKMTAKKAAAGAKQDIGNMQHQKGVGSASSQQPEKPKPLTHKTT